MTFVKFFAPIFAGTLAALSFSGCSTYPERAEAVREACALQNYKKAAELTREECEKAGENDRLQWQLDNASCHWLERDFAAAETALETARESCEFWDEKADTLISKEIAAGVGNLSDLPYRGRDSDRIMLHTYRALNFLSQNNIPAARTALNAVDREQNLTTERRSSQIEKARAAAEKNKVDKKSLDEQCRIVNQKLAEDSKNDATFEIYADYINPFSTWLYGIYFLNAGTGNGDIERSRHALARVEKMVPGNPVVRTDLALAETHKIPSGAPATYVIFEYGKIANFREWRLDLLLPFPGTVVPVGIALPRINCPKLSPQTNHAFNYEIPKMTANGVNANLVCDMNRIRVTEFHDNYPSIVMRTLTTAFVKSTASAAANIAAKQSRNLFFQIATTVGTTIYSLTSAGADLRAWQTLPRSFSIVKIPTPADRKIDVSVGGRQSSVIVPDAAVTVICVSAETLPFPLKTNAFVLKK